VQHLEGLARRHDLGESSEIGEGQGVDEHGAGESGELKQAELAAIGVKRVGLGVDGQDRLAAKLLSEPSELGRILDEADRRHEKRESSTVPLASLSSIRYGRRHPAERRKERQQMGRNGQHPPKAYRNTEFLGSREARTIRLLSEYLEPERRLRHYHVEDTIVFFGSARALPPDSEKGGRGTGEDDRLSRYYGHAEELAYRLTGWSKALAGTKRRFIVTSGGGGGMMEAANRGASRAGGVTVGFGISLPMEPSINPYVSRELAFEFHYFFMRKFWFVYLAKAIVVFPGGFGTLDELFELLTLIQTGKSQMVRPVVLFGREFWEKLIDFDLMVSWGVISAEDLRLFRVVDTVEEAFEFLTGALNDLHDLD
jgi:uncharacterized protein (TIGR00730 family)